MDISVELTPEEREVVRDRLLVEQRVRFKGQKKAAYQAAGVNSATWANAIKATRVRPDRLVQIVSELWPESGGDWAAVPSPTAVTLEVAGSSHKHTTSEASVKAGGEAAPGVDSRLRALEEQVAALVEAFTLFAADADQGSGPISIAARRKPGRGPKGPDVQGAD